MDEPTDLERARFRKNPIAQTILHLEKLGLKFESDADATKYASMSLEAVTAVIEFFAGIIPDDMPPYIASYLQYLAIGTLLGMLRESTPKEQIADVLQRALDEL